MMTLTLHLANALPDTVDESTYGNPHLSDHSLYFNCKNDKDLSRTLSDKKIQVTSDEYVKLKEKRNKLLTFIRRTRLTVLEDMDFDGIIYM